MYRPVMTPFVTARPYEGASIGTYLWRDFQSLQSGEARAFTRLS